MALGLGDDLAGPLPSVASDSRSIRSNRCFCLVLFILGDRLLHQGFGACLEAGVGGKAEGVGEVVLFAHLVHPGQAKARVAADMNDDIGTFLA